MDIRLVTTFNFLTIVIAFMLERVSVTMPFSLDLSSLTEIFNTYGTYVSI